MLSSVIFGLGQIMTVFGLVCRVFVMFQYPVTYLALNVLGLIPDVSLFDILLALFELASLSRGHVSLFQCQC